MSLMRRLMEAKFAKASATPVATPEKVTSAPGWRAERSARISEGQLRRNAPSLEQAVEQANRELGRTTDAFKLIDRTVELLKGAPPAPVPTSARGSCKAINQATGLQCALLAGHTKPHRHGRTEFTRLAVPGERFTRREQLETYASVTHTSPFGG